MTYCETAAKDESVYALVEELILKFISETMKTTSQIEELSEVWEKTIKVFDEAERLNMDKKQVLVNVINWLIKVV